MQPANSLSLEASEPSHRYAEVEEMLRMSATAIEYQELRGQVSELNSAAWSAATLGEIFMSAIGLDGSFELDCGKTLVGKPRYVFSDLLVVDAGSTYLVPYRRVRSASLPEAAVALGGSPPVASLGQVVRRLFTQGIWIEAFGSGGMHLGVIARVGSDWVHLGAPGLGHGASSVGPRDSGYRLFSLHHLSYLQIDPAVTPSQIRVDFARFDPPLTPPANL